MTKKLTEQWKNGTLKEGYYYIKNKSQSIKFIEVDYYNVWGDTRYWSGCDDEDIEEVLATVPTYEEWEELQEANDGLSKRMFKSLMNRFVKADEEREKLEEQLKEAEKKLYDVLDCRGSREYYAEKAKEYFEKWGVE